MIGGLIRSMLNVAIVKVLPIANINVANWELENGTGNIGNIGTFLSNDP